MENPTLHTRIAKVLGWSIEETQSYSMQSLREFVRPLDSKLADAISTYIASEECLARPRRRK